MAERIGGLMVSIALFVLMAGNIGISQANQSPKELVTDIEGATRISAEDVFDLYEKLPGLVIVDSRLATGPSSGRANGFIEGSVSLPDTETNCGSLARIFPGKKSPGLFYCNGLKCGRSAKAIKIALECGYTNIYWFRGGFDEWLVKGYPYIKP